MSVRREDLHSASTSPSSSPDPELASLFLSKVSNTFEAIPAPLETIDTNNEHDNEDDGLHAFRFFKSGATDNDQTQTVRITSPALEPRESGFVYPSRPKSYYFTGKVSQKRLEQLQLAAVSGSDVLLRSQRPCPGCALPWKVTRISISGKTSIFTSAKVGERNGNTVMGEGRVKRKRPGKKHRIASRVKAAAQKEKVVKSQQDQVAKEAAEREKRTRRNREKKVKKKERDKEKKAAAAVEMAAASSDES